MTLRWRNVQCSHTTAAHIQWVASVIRKCVDMVPSSALQVDIFVTNVVAQPPPAPSLELHVPHGDTLAPPTPHFARPGSRSRRNSNASDISMDSAISTNTFTDVSYMRVPQAEDGYGNDAVDIVDMYGGLGHEEHVLDLTNFDGEDDTRLPGETQLSRRLRKEGKLRRARTRKSQSVLLAKHELDQRATDARLSSHIPQGPFTSRYPRSESSTSPPAVSTGLRNPSPLNPSSPVDPPFSSLSPDVPKRHSFLYADPGETSRSVSPAPSALSGTFTVRDSDAYYAERPTRHARTQSKFGLDDVEAEDVPIVAERARPGRAKIDRIIADEAGRSRGAMVVACESFVGPSLCSLMTCLVQVAVLHRLMRWCVRVWPLRLIHSVSFGGTCGPASR